MFVVQRIDKTYGQFERVHETLEEAIEEAKRLVKIHISETPRFVIYQLKEKCTISGNVKIRIAKMKGQYDVI